MAAIVQDSKGSFVAGIKLSSNSKHFLKCLLQVLSELHSKKVSFHVIRLSNEEITLLGRDNIVDWDLFLLNNKIFLKLKGIEVSRVSYALNRPADMLCHAKVRSLFTNNIIEMPDNVHVAILIDDKPHHCLFKY